MFETILLAIGHFDRSRRAVPVTCEIARRFESEVIVLHVREIGTASAETPEESLALVERVARQLKDEGISARPAVGGARVSSVAAEIVALAKAEGVGLIVVGSRGFSDLQGLLGRSITHRVEHLAECPVLSIRY